MGQNIEQIHRMICSGQVTVRSRVEEFLDRCEKNKILNAFLELFAADALRRADEIDRKQQKGRLAGAVIGIKDNICFKDHHCSASSRILESFISPYHATVVERLLREDAVIIGRLNCDEFAMGGSNENSAFGPVLNPWDHTRVPGGSSGGSAAAVAAGLCDAALGSDTGGSIRQPASFCGITGLKPSYGRVSRFGLIAYASSFDQIGPLTRSVDDAALLLEIMAGADPNDATCSSRPVPAYSSPKAIKEPVTIAYIEETLSHPSLDPEIAGKLREIINNASSMGIKIKPVHFPYLDYIVPAYYTMVMAEASSNLARFDGIHYGYRSPNASDIEEVYRKSRTEGFGTEVKRRIMAGTFVLSAGYYDAYYTKAQKMRRIIRDCTNQIFKEAEFLLLPATPSTAFKLEEKNSDPVEMYLQDIFTVHANMTGIPAMTLPAGTHSNGLPFGVQLCTKPFEEQRLLSFARSLNTCIPGLR